MFLLDNLAVLPLKGVIWVFEQIADYAEKELKDPETLKARLLELNLQYEQGEIDEEKYAAQEAMLLERIRQAQEELQQEAEANAEEDEA